MQYDIHYNHLTNTWVIWAITDNGATQYIIKRFKTEAAARKWVARH